MAVASIDPDLFLRLVQPLLEAQDLPGLLNLLRSRWTMDQMLGLLACPHEDARKVAALALGLVGTRCCVKPLSEQLKHPDPVVNDMAEHALWTIWFRLGTPEANHQLARGTQALTRRDFDHAMCHFSKAIELDPSFAEAYNQRALAEYLQEQYEPAIEDSRQATARMPCHFAAWAGMGHCQAHLGRREEAIRSYERALAINPHLTCVKEAVEALRRCRRQA
jgi:tetratricopeptide (TPR) repeat protein